MKKFGFTLFALSTLTLIGCSGGAPSDSDIEALFRAEQEKAVATAATMVGQEKAKKMAGEVHSISKKNCAEISDGAYICEVTVDMSAPFAGRNKTDITVKIVKGENGWIMTKA